VAVGGREGVIWGFGRRKRSDTDLSFLVTLSRLSCDLVGWHRLLSHLRQIIAASSPLDPNHVYS
jgi:hypothetical protein